MTLVKMFVVFAALCFALLNLLGYVRNKEVRARNVWLKVSRRVLTGITILATVLSICALMAYQNHSSYPIGYVLLAYVVEMLTCGVGLWNYQWWRNKLPLPYCFM